MWALGTEQSFSPNCRSAFRRVEMCRTKDKVSGLRAVLRHDGHQTPIVVVSSRPTWSSTMNLRVCASRLLRSQFPCDFSHPLGVASKRLTTNPAPRIRSAKEIDEGGYAAAWAAY